MGMPLSTSRLRRDQGFSLMEFLIASAISMIILSGLINLFGNSLQSNSDYLRMVRVNQELSSIMNIITRGLRRSGHWGLVENVVNLSNNRNTDMEFNGYLDLSAVSGAGVTLTLLDPEDDPAGCPGSLEYTFAPLQAALPGMVMKHVDSGGNEYTAEIVSFTSNCVLTADIDAATPFPATQLLPNTWTLLNPFNGITISGGNCIHFLSDLDMDGIVDDGPDVDTNEYFGFRLDAATGSIQMRKNGTSFPDCSVAGALADNWVNVNDPDVVEITAFDLSDAIIDVNEDGFTNNMHNIAITLSGQLKSDTTVTRTLTETVRVRNDEIF